MVLATHGGASTLRDMASDEPITPEAVAAWIAETTRASDRFRAVYDASEAHRLEHGGDCDVFPSGSGPLLGALVAAAGAKRILEVGCGLGYSALWLAHGARPDGIVETCEQSPVHAAIAQQHFRTAGVESRVSVRVGNAADTMSQMTEGFDFIFCDGDPAEYPADLEHFMRLLKPGGTLATSNLFLGIYVPDAPWLDATAAYRQRILNDPTLDTVFLRHGPALSVRVR